LRAIEESRENRIKGHVLAVKEFLIETAKRQNDIKEIKKFSKAMDELDRIMELL